MLLSCVGVHRDYVHFIFNCKLFVMKPENQVCTLGQAKKLKELGIKQSSLFYHEIIMPSSGTGSYPIHNINYLGKTVYEKWSAFTVAELGVMLPKDFYSHKTCKDGMLGEGFWCIQDDKEKECGYCGADNYIYHHNTHSPTEAQARAAMLIYLIENGHITPEEVNNRLLNA